MADACGAELELIHILPEKAKRDDLPGQRASAMHRLEQALSAERVLKLNTKFLVRGRSLRCRRRLPGGRRNAVESLAELDAR